mgnify:FL=1
MKKPNAQAELLSQPAGALRGSRPFFIFFNRLQAQAYSRGLRALRGSPAQLYFFLFFNRLQAQAHSNRRGQPRLSRPFFFIFLIR